MFKVEILKQIGKAVANSVLADQTADISEITQLSIELRYFHKKNSEIQKAFVSFAKRTILDTK